MSSPKKIGCWNRFEIAFNKGMRSEAEACQRDWREKWGKTRGMGGWGRQDEPTSEQAGRAESTLAQNGEEKPTSEQAGRAESTSARRRFEQETFAETSPSESRTSTVVRSVGEEARRSKIDAEAKKNVDSTLKLERLDKSEGLKKLEKAKKPTSKRDFPFGKPRARTFRSSAAPRRFDRLQRDQEEDEQK